MYAVYAVQTNLGDTALTVHSTISSCLYMPEALQRVGLITPSLFRIGCCDPEFLGTTHLQSHSDVRRNPPVHDAVLLCFAVAPVAEQSQRPGSRHHRLLALRLPGCAACTQEVAVLAHTADKRCLFSCKPDKGCSHSPAMPAHIGRSLRPWPRQVCPQRGSHTHCPHTGCCSIAHASKGG